MSDSEFDLDEALDIVAEARERKQKLRDGCGITEQIA
jgi:hypothetical protein